MIRQSMLNSAEKVLLIGAELRMTTQFYLRAGRCQKRSYASLHSNPDHIRGLYPFGLRATTEIQHLCSCAGNRLAMF